MSLSASPETIKAEHDRLEDLNECPHLLGVRAIRDEMGDVVFLCVVCRREITEYLKVPE